MNFKKLYGWNDSTVAEIQHVVRTTRDQLKNIIAGMRWRPRDNAYVIHIVDRTGLTARVMAVSKDFGSKEKLRDRYERFCQHFNLPYCCRPHEREYQGTELDGLFDEDSDIENLFDDDDEIESLFDDEDDDFDLGLDDDEYDDFDLD